MYTNIITNTANGPLSTSAKKRRCIFERDAFPYGSVIQPDWDQIAGYHEEHGRKQLCITEQEQDLIKQLSSLFDYEQWRMGRWVHRRPGRPQMLLVWLLLSTDIALNTEFRTGVSFVILVIRSPRSRLCFQLSMTP